MNFQPELAAKVLAGTKVVTRRPVKDSGKACRYRPGRPYAVQIPRTEGPGRGRGGKAIGYIHVTDVMRETLRMLSASEAVREGFADREAFRDYWVDLHGDYDLGQLVDRIAFVLIDPEEYPLWGVSVEGRAA